jgi:hypothetical protein
METIDRGSPVVPCWSDRASRTLRERIHQRLRENLRSFERLRSWSNDSLESGSEIPLGVIASIECSWQQRSMLLEGRCDLL